MHLPIAGLGLGLGLALGSFFALGFAFAFALRAIRGFLLSAVAFSLASTGLVSRERVSNMGLEGPNWNARVRSNEARPRMGFIMEKPMV